MRHPILVSLCLGGTVLLAGCQGKNDAAVQRAVKSVNVIDETNLNDIMLTVGDPAEAVTYFQKASGENPDRMDLKRDLAKSLVRARHPAQAVVVWSEVVKSDSGTNEDKVALAGALIRADKWKKSEAVLNSIPPTYETYGRYRLEAMIADSNKQWKKADSFYETAVGLTTQPAGVLNNWGYSKLTRRDYKGAERLFAQALTYDKTLFTAKNNMVLARGAQRNYQLPIIPMTQNERAQLLYTLALSAVKQGDVTMGKSLLKDAINTSPRQFEAAARSLQALEANVTN